MEIKNLLIAIKSTTASPWKDRTIECYNTWGKEFIKLGVDIVALEENPTQQENYIFSNNILYSKASVEKEGIFYKHLYYPFQWFLQETSYEYLVIVDADTFVHPQRFLNRLKYWKESYSEIEYIGSAIPMRGWNFLTPYTQIVKTGEYWASGCFYVAKRSLISKFISKFNFQKHTVTHHDDYTLGLFCSQENIPLLHDSSICFQSPSDDAGVLNSLNIAIPFIKNLEGEHLIAQHYLTGKMDEISNTILK